MATSGTFGFSPSLTDIVLDAYDRMGIRGPEITAPQIVSARRSLNYCLVRFANNGVNLWSVALTSVPLIQGTATYNVDPSTVTILDVYRTINSGGTPQDIVLSSLSRTDYASIPNKTTQAPPTSYWFNHLLSPTITLYPTPDQTSYYVLNYYRMTQIQDANPVNGQTADVPYLFLEALCSTLAGHLAMKWKPDMAPALLAYAKEVWAEAALENRERAPLYLQPNLDPFFQ